MSRLHERLLAYPGGITGFARDSGLARKTVYKLLQCHRRKAHPRPKMEAALMAGLRLSRRSVLRLIEEHCCEN